MLECLLEVRRGFGDNGLVEKMRKLRLQILTNTSTQAKDFGHGQPESRVPESNIKFFGFFKLRFKVTGVCLYTSPSLSTYIIHSLITLAASLFGNLNILIIYSVRRRGLKLLLKAQ